MAEPDFLALRQVAERKFHLAKTSTHGPKHWTRVEAGAVRLARSTGADLLVVRLFALFHDCARQNDEDDPEHGRRAAQFLAGHRARLFELNDERFALLREAIAYHADGTTHQNATIGTCWDADRLDLTRCGIVPSPQFFSTEAGREEARALRRKAKSLCGH